MLAEVTRSQILEKIRKNGYASFVLHEGFVRADNVIVFRRHRQGSPISVEIVCPACGEIGYLHRIKPYNTYYYRIKHVEGDRERCCYIHPKDDGYEFLDMVYATTRRMLCRV